LPPPLAVVVVRDEGAADANLTEHVEPLCPPWVIAHLVDLVNRERIRTESDGGRAREGQATAARDFFDELVAHPVVPPVPNGVRWAAWPGEHVIRVANTPEELLDLERGRASAVPKRCDRDLGADVLTEVRHDAERDLVSVLLEAEGRIEKDVVDVRIADPRDQLLVDRRHHGTRLARTEEGNQPGWMTLMLWHDLDATGHVASIHMNMRSLTSELLAQPPDQFTARRNARVKELKASGQAELARELAALKKPAVHLWAANQVRDRAQFSGLRRAAQAVARAQAAAAMGRANAAQDLR